MTVTVDNPRWIQFVSSASQTDFPYDFKIFDVGDLDVFVNGILKSEGAGQDYTVTGVGIQTGGNVVFNVGLVLDDIVTINSNIEDVQLTDYTTGGEFTGLSIETALDKLTTSIQQFTTLLEQRGLTYNVTDILLAGDTTIPKLLEGQFWKFSGGGIKAVLDVEDPGATTLRSELESQTDSSPGSDIIGTFNTRTAVGETLKEHLDTYTLPVDDPLTLVRDPVDNTKQMRIDVGAVAPATTRVITMGDRDVNLFPATGAKVEVGTDDVNYLTSKSLTDGTGAALQRVESVVTAESSSSLRIPYDNTIPQQTEGFEFTTVTITPKRSDTNLLIEYQLNTVSGSAGSQDVIKAIFRDSAADAIYATMDRYSNFGASNGVGSVTVLSGSLASTTFKLRAGADLGSSDATFFNGDGPGAGVFNGVSKSFLKVTEVIA